jgi:hypothetical protein
VLADRPKRKLGFYGDTIKIDGDFNAPLPNEILDVFQEKVRRKRKQS